MKITKFDIYPYNICIAAGLQNFIFKGVHYMNKIKKRSLKMTLLVVLLIGILLTSQMMHAMATSTQPVAIASNFTQLHTAMIQAKDGDVIGITAGFDQFADQVMGYTDKHITIRRMNSSAFIRIRSSNNAKYQNITFDGNGIDAGTAFVLVDGKVTFQDVNFINSITNTANGGAVYVMGSSPSFLNCTFDNNTAVQGGHMYVSTGIVTIQNSIFTNGHALSDGGAIKSNTQYPNKTEIVSSIITDNSAVKYGGGLSVVGYMHVADTKIYNNIAQGGGADIARPGVGGSLSMYDSFEIEGLLELYKDDVIVPKGWVNDYNAESGVEFPIGNDLTSPYVLMKLDYEIPPTEVTLSPSSLGTASDGKIIGLESGKRYKITSNDVVSYSKADGSVTATETEASPLVGTEIIGLTNGETYMVEEFTPAPTTVLLDSASLGTADNEKIIGLSAGKIYKVSVDETINYSKADGTLTSNETEATALEGTEIVGLVNGVTYLVDEYIPPVEEEPKDPVDQEDPDDEEPGEEQPTDPVDEEDPTDPGTDEDPIQGSNTTTTTNSNNTSNTTNNTTNNSTAHNSDSRDDSSTVNNKDESSTVNNYSYDYSNNTKTESSVLPSNDAIGEKGGQASASQHQTITVDYGSIVDGIKVQEDGKNITINVNVNVDTNEMKEDEAEPQAVEVASSNVEAVQSPSSASNITWVELVKICLLFGIFICVFRRPIAK